MPPRGRSLKNSMIFLEIKGFFRKILLVSVKFVCPQFWGQKWVRQFYGHLEKMRSFCRKNHVRKIPLFWGGVLGGGGSADFIFMGARIFLKGRRSAFCFPKASPRFLARSAKSKKPSTRVSKRVPGVHGKRGLERGWQKRLAKGWRKVGRKGWQKVGEGLAKGFLAPSNIAISEAPV